MNSVDPKLTALRFNEYINRQDIDGLTGLRTEGHTFIDRKGQIDMGKKTMTRDWIDFFKSFPDYRKTFERVQSKGDFVILYGFATWEKGAEPDYAIWTVRIVNYLVAEWRIYEDTEDNKKLFNLI